MEFVEKKIVFEYITEKNYIVAHCVEAKGGTTALADMSAKNLSFF